MKFAEYVEFATRTNRLGFDEDLIFRTISDVNVIADQLISRIFKNRWWLSGLDVPLSRRRPLVQIPVICLINFC